MFNYQINTKQKNSVAVFYLDDYFIVKLHYY